MHPDYLLENNVSEQDFEQIVYQWLAEGDYTPDDIIENIISENNLSLMPIYFSKDEYHGYCSASLGYLRQEDYYVWDDYNKKQIRKSRTVTDWRPHSQNIQGTTTTTTYVGNPISEQAMTFIENMGWAGEALRPIPMDIPRYHEICNLFKQDKNESWNNRGYKKAYQEALQQTIPKLPSRIQANLSLDVKFSESHFFSLLAPYWLFGYQYKEEMYYVIVDGHTPSRIDGTKPEDKKRKNEVFKIKALGCSVGLLTIVVALYFFNNESFDNLEINFTNSFIFILVVLIISALIGHEVNKVKNKSRAVRRLRLEKKLKKLKQ